MTTATVAEISLPESPYRGIESFRYVDQPIFFARNKETHQLLRFVAVYRGVLFYGDSGSGKSSLINAGFIPAIIAEGFTPDRLRVQPRPGEEIIVERISTSTDGKAPYLHSSLVDAKDTNARIVMSAAEMKKRIQELGANSRPLLIFDQFEEFSTLFEETPRGEEIKQAQDAQEAIIKVVIELLRDTALPVKLLFVFREDYLAKLARLFALRPELSDQYQRLMPPGINVLHEIIRGSFEKFPGHFGKELSEDLTRDLAAAIEARSESNKLNLSEVQIACLKLWQSQNPDALFKDKGVQGLLEDYLSDSLNRLGDLRDPAVALLSRMVTTSGTRNIISQDDLITQVNEDEDIPEDRLKAALESLVQDTKLVRRERRYKTYFYDIVSEFLVPWITRQKALRLAETERRKVAEAESLKRLKAYRVAFVSLLMALVVVGGALYFNAKRTKEAIVTSKVKEADERLRIAEQSKMAAEAAKGRAEQLKNQAESMAQAALHAKQLTDQNNADLTAKLGDTSTKLADADKEIIAVTGRADKAERERNEEKKKKEDAQKENLKIREEYIAEINKLKASQSQVKRGTKQ